jgi:hypothetical protein
MTVPRGAGGERGSGVRDTPWGDLVASSGLGNERPGRAQPPRHASHADRSGRRSRRAKSAPPSQRSTWSAGEPFVVPEQRRAPPAVLHPARAAGATPEPSRNLLLTVLTFLLLIAGTAAAVTRFWIPAGVTNLPPHLPGYGSVVLTGIFVGLVSHRLIGPWRLATVLAAGVGLAAVITGRVWLVGGAASLAAVSSGVLAVVITRPGSSVFKTLRELVVAVATACIGALAVGGYAAPLQIDTFRLLTIVATVLGCLVVAQRLGGGFDELDRRTMGIVVAAVFALVVAAVYSRAFDTWASQGLVDAVDSLANWLRDTIGAVPRPLEWIVGIPALVWGVRSRALRHQGWWICAFGGIATGYIASSLGEPHVDLSQAMLGTAYAVLIGAVLGLALAGLDASMARPDVHRSHQADRELVERAEPGRRQPLL